MSFNESHPPWCGEEKRHQLILKVLSVTGFSNSASRAAIKHLLAQGLWQHSELQSGECLFPHKQRCDPCTYEFPSKGDRSYANTRNRPRPLHRMPYVPAGMTLSCPSHWKQLERGQRQCWGNGNTRVPFSQHFHPPRKTAAVSPSRWVAKTQAHSEMMDQVSKHFCQMEVPDPSMNSHHSFILLMFILSNASCSDTSVLQLVHLPAVHSRAPALS